MLVARRNGSDTFVEPHDAGSPRDDKLLVPCRSRAQLALVVCSPALQRARDGNRACLQVAIDRDDVLVDTDDVYGARAVVVGAVPKAASNVSTPALHGGRGGDDAVVQKTRSD